MFTYPVTFNHFAEEAAPSGWDISGATYDNKSRTNYMAVGTTFDVSFNPDGTKMYMFDSQRDVYQYTLSTAWDVSTASWTSGNWFRFTKTTTGYAMGFNSDGSKLYYSYSSKIYEYNTVTNWLVQGSTYVGFLNTGGIGCDSVDFEFNSDGTKLYAMDTSSASIYQYSLSTAWDVSSGSYDTVLLDLSSEMSVPRGFELSTDGTQIFVTGSGTGVGYVYQYSLPTAWSLSGGSYDSVLFDHTSEFAKGSSVTFKPDGTKMYISSLVVNGAVFQYSL